MRVWQYLGRVFVRTPNGCRIRWPSKRENQRCCRLDELHAQHRAERGNLGCNHVDCAAKSISLVASGRIHALSSLQHRGRYVNGSLTHVGLSTYSAHQQALARMYSLVMVQAQTLSYVEVYWLLAVLSALMFFLSFLRAKNEPGAAGEVAIHCEDVMAKMAQHSLRSRLLGRSSRCRRLNQCIARGRFDPSACEGALPGVRRQSTVRTCTFQTAF